MKLAPLYKNEISSLQAKTGDWKGSNSQTNQLQIQIQIHKSWVRSKEHVLLVATAPSEHISHSIVSFVRYRRVLLDSIDISRYSLFNKGKKHPYHDNIISWLWCQTFSHHFVIKPVLESVRGGSRFHLPRQQISLLNDSVGEQGRIHGSISCVRVGRGSIVVG